MGFLLLIHDEQGVKIGQMVAVRADQPPEVTWRSPFVYEYEITHPNPERWGGVEAALRQSTDPHEVGKTGEGAIETDEISFVPDRVIRVDTDGPQAYLREVAEFVEWHGAVSTEIIEN